MTAMKRLLLLLTVVFLYSSSYSSTKTITLHFNASDFNLETESGFTYITSEKYQLLFDTDTLCPALPFVNISLLLPKDADVLGFTMNKVENILQNNVLIPLNTSSIPTDSLMGNSYSFDIPVYSNRIYPDSIVRYVENYNMDGYNNLQISVYPFRYDTLTEQLFIESDISITISYLTLPQNLEYGYNHNIRKFVKHSALNGHEIDSLYNLFPTRSGQNRIIDENKIEYLVITSNSLKNSFQKLVDWKRMKGVKAHIITSNDIINAYPNGGADYNRIKMAIRDIYDNSDGQLKYVLLGGNLSHVKSPKCRIKRKGVTDEVPTDWFYACLKTMNWDSNNNGIIGEVADNVDLLPYFSVTRLPVTSSSDADSLISRIINYERGIGLSTWKKGIVMGGVKSSWNYFWVGKSDTHYKGEWIYKEYIQYNWNGTLKKFYDTGTNFSGGANYDVTVSHFNDVMDLGYPFFHFDTHGNCTELKMETGAVYMTADASSINNPSYTIITTNACNTNEFDSPSFYLSRGFLMYPNTGVVAYLGSSRKGLGYTCPWNLGESNNINGRFYYYLFKKKMQTFGRAATFAKCEYISECKKQDSPFRYLLFSINPMGDPEMPIYIDTPQTFSNANCYYENGALHVDAGVDGCKICVMSIQDKGASYYSVVDDVQEATFQENVGECSVCITKYGYIPYVVSVPNTTYIQDATIYTDSTIISGDIYIGRDVTNEKPQGNVTVESGTLTLNKTGKVFIKNGFKVKSGAQFRIP